MLPAVYTAAGLTFFKEKMGTIINTAAVILGALFGMLLKNGIKQRFNDILMSALGLATMFIGASGALAGMLSVNEGGGLSSGGSMLLVISLILGSLAGEALKIEDRLESLGDLLKRKVKAKGDSRFTEGFVTASLVICVGAMAVVGSLNDGLTGDYSTLLVKSALDFVIVLIFASAMGIGVMFSALPLAVYQGAITVFAKLLAPVMTDSLIGNLSYIGSALIFCVGVNLAFGKKFKTGNMLPTLLVPVFYEIILQFI